MQTAAGHPCRTLRSALQHRLQHRLHASRRAFLTSARLDESALLPNSLSSGRVLAVGAIVFAGRAVFKRRHPGCIWPSSSLAGQACRPSRAWRCAVSESEASRRLSPSFWKDDDSASDWCAVYINLARREDRKERLYRQLSVANHTFASRLRRINAVDGKKLSFEDKALLEVVDDYALEKAVHAKRRGAFTIVHNGGRLLHFDNHLTPGGIACALSHRLALQAVAEHPSADWGIILEDDIVAAAPRAEEVVAGIVKGLPDDWDAVFLGYHDDAGRAHPSALAAEETGRTEEVAEVTVRALREPLYGLFAWAVRKEAAQALLENAFPIGGQVDHALSAWLVHERNRCYQVEPGSMVFFSPKSEEAEDSDIQSMATVDVVMDRYESWQGYHEHMWGLDAMMEEYILGAVGDADMSDLEDWGSEELGFSMSLPPCDVPPPECLPAEYPDM